MAISLDKTLPSGYYYREAWLMQDIWSPDAATFYIPPSCKGGHRATLTGGAYKATSTNGLIMRGAEKVTITDPAAISINDNLTVTLPTFVLNTLFSSASGADMGIMTLNNGSVLAWLESDTGAMKFTFKDADGAADYTISSTKVSWAVDTEWQVSFCFDKDAGASSVEIFVNGVSDSTHADADTVLTIPAGDTVYGYDGTTFFTGKFTRGPIIWDTALVSAANLVLVYKGIPFATNLKLQHQLDEGMGLAVDDKVAAALDGLISGTNTADIWDYDVEQVLLGLDGRTGYATAAGVDISGSTSLVWVGKMKSTHAALGANVTLAELYVDANDSLRLFADTSSNLSYYAEGANAPKTLTIAVAHSMNDYLVLIGTVDTNGRAAFYRQGVQVDTDTAVGIRSVAVATAYIGSINGPAGYGVSKPCGVFLIDGALPQAWAKQYTQRLVNWMGL